MTDAQAVREAMDEAAQTLGGLDICLANAGILIADDSLEFDVEKWRKVIDVNLMGYFITAGEAARTMLERNGGSIVQINSKSGKKGSYKNSAYASCKFGGIGVTQSLALEFAVRPGGGNSLFKQYAQTQGISEHCWPKP